MAKELTTAELISAATNYRNSAITSYVQGQSILGDAYVQLSIAASSLATARLLQEQTPTRIMIEPTPRNLGTSILNCNAEKPPYKEMN
jgi:hypothetical protein